MANLGFVFNPTQFDPTQGAGQLPLGTHEVIISSDEIKGTKDDPNSHYLMLNLKIISGQFAGVTGVERLNLWNKSEQASKIAHNRLSTYFHAVCYLQPQNDTAVLWNIPFKIEVRPQEKNPQYTEIGKIFDINGNEIGKPVTNQPQQAAAPAQFAAPQGFANAPGQQAQAPAFAAGQVPVFAQQQQPAPAFAHPAATPTQAAQPQGFYAAFAQQPQQPQQQQAPGAAVAPPGWVQR